MSEKKPPSDEAEAPKSESSPASLSETPTPHQPEVSPADESGRFTVSPDLDGIAPLLERTVSHIKRSNQSQRSNNNELLDISALMRRQQRLMWGLLALLGVQLGATTLLLARTGTLLGEIRDSAQKMESIAGQIVGLGTDTKDMRKELEKRPRLTIETAKSAKPSLILEAMPEERVQPTRVRIPLDEAIPEE